jgi:murein L,D-transpeptidase YcbB/YkuD
MTQAGTARAFVPRMSSTRRVACALTLLVVPLAARSLAASDSAVAAAVQVSLATEPLVVDNVTLDGPRLRALYEGRTGSPFWLDRVDNVTRVIAEAASEGLDPTWYPLAAIAYRAPDTTAEGLAARELLLSDALLRYATDVRYGRMRPNGVRGEAEYTPAPDGVALVRWVAESPDLEGALGQLPPQHASYRRLRDVLKTYQTALAEGRRWPVVPDGPSLRPGMSHAAVPLLRDRLIASGDLPATAVSASRVYDDELVAAVQGVQTRASLKPDGVVGPAVRAVLNTGIAERLDQIRANLERWRWMPEDLGARRVVVNVAAARVRFVDEDRTRFDGPVIVGDLDTRTPTFSSIITQVIFNPSWTVPDSIARKELLPKAERDSSYLARQGINLVGSWRPTVSPDDPAQVSFAGARRAAGVRLRQPPGPRNPLGRVKFNIPNAFGVYLHDTNNRSLFARDRRTLSHGCVRVGDALAFADLILETQPGWSEERKRRALAGWKTAWIGLEHPVAVHLMYETVWSDADGQPHFHADVYGRDRRLVDAMTGRVRVVEAATLRPAEP